MTKAHRESAELERVILGLLSQRSAQGSICPSDTARAAAGRLAVRGEVDISQGGRVIDIAAARRPVRIRRHRPG